MDATFGLELTHPWRLACLAILPVVAYYFYRGLTDFPRGSGSSRWRCERDRGAAGVCAGGPSLLRPTGERFVVFVVDRSLSIGGESTQSAETFLDRPPRLPPAIASPFCPSSCAARRAAN